MKRLLLFFKPNLKSLLPPVHKAARATAQFFRLSPDRAIESECKRAAPAIMPRRVRAGGLSSSRRLVAYRLCLLPGFRGFLIIPACARVYIPRNRRFFAFILLSKSTFFVCNCEWCSCVPLNRYTNASIHTLFIPLYPRTVDAYAICRPTR